MKRLLSTGLAWALALALAGVAAAVQPTQFKVSAQNGSGENGTATILQSGTDEIIVVVRMSGAPTGVAQPMHIHKGTCAKLDPRPAFPLTSLQDGKSESKVKGITLAELEKDDYAINVHKSAKDVATYVACGNLKVMGAMAQ